MAAAVASQLWGPDWTPLDRAATGVDAVFDAFDLNRDGVITRAEVSDVLGGPATGRRRAFPGPSADVNLGFDPQLGKIEDVEALLEGHRFEGREPGLAFGGDAADNRASAFHSIAYGPALGGGFCGDRLQFTISTVTSSGRKCYDTEARVTAEVTGVSLLSKSLPEPRPWVDDRKDGTYVVQFVCATPGQYSVVARVNGTSLPLCPVMIDVAPGRASAQHSDILGAGLSTCLAGAQTDFTILARDEFGNECVRGGARFGVRAVGHTRLHEVADNEDGSYTVSYSVPEWAQGPVRLEVMLDGVPLKGSPIMPRVQHMGKRDVPGVDAGSADLAALSAGLLPADLRGLEWLKSHQPPSVPEVPYPGSAVNELTAFNRPGGPEAISATASARTAWRAADEWRALSELRGEFERCRDGLLRHQQLLVKVGDAVQKEVGMIKEKERSVDMLRDDLTQVEDRLAWQRRYLSGEYARRLNQDPRYDGRLGLEPAFMPLTRQDGSPSQGVRSPAGREEEAPLAHALGLDESNEKIRHLQQEVEKKRQWLQSLLDEEEIESRSRVRTRSLGPTHRDHGTSSLTRERPGVSALRDATTLKVSGDGTPSIDVFGLLDRNQDGVITREEWMQAQERAAQHAANNAGEYPQLPQVDPPYPLPGLPVNEGVAAETAALRLESKTLNDQLRRHLIDQEARRPAGERFPQGRLGDSTSPAGQSQARLGQRFTVPPPPSPPPVAPAAVEAEALFNYFDRDSDGVITRQEWQEGAGHLAASSRSPLLAVPPPPAPPPAVPGLSSAGLSAPATRWPQVGSTSGNPQAVAAAMRRLFQAYATSSYEGPVPPRGGNSLHAMLHLHDLTRLLTAAQVKLPASEVEAAFQATIRHFGVGLEPPEGAPAVPYELFVELVINLARRTYRDLSDSAAAAALFEDHLLPLERRLKGLER